MIISKFQRSFHTMLQRLRYHTRDLNEPRILHYLIGHTSHLGVRAEHLLQQRTTFTRRQIRQRSRHGRAQVRMHKFLECGVRHLRHSPWEFLALHTIEHNGNSPDIDKACIVLLLLKLLWRNIGLSRRDPCCSESIFPSTFGKHHSHLNR